MKKKHPWLVEIGKNIRAIRESKGLSQEELAELVEIDRTYIGGIERGERNVASLNLIRIAIALNTEVGNLFPRLDILQLSSSS
jgi:transcriptional regulator with XRE-family HTH domain